MAARLLSWTAIRDRWTIRSQTAVLTALLCALAVAISVLAAAFLARQDAMENADEELETLSRMMAYRLEQHMFERYREIRNTATMPALRTIWKNDEQAIRPVIDQLQATLPEYAWVGFVNAAGEIRVATKGLLEGVSVADGKLFLDASKGPAMRDVHHSKRLGPLLGSPGAPARFVDVAMPVYAEDGSLAGVLGALINWSWAEEVRKDVLSDRHAARSTEIWLLDSTGKIIMGPEGHPGFSDQVRDMTRNAHTVFQDTTGPSPVMTALVATSPVHDYPGLGWVVAARMPIDIIHAPANRLAGTILLIGAAVGLCGALLAWIVAGAVTRPLRDLTVSLDAIGRDPEIRSAERQHGSRDVLLLSAAVRSLLRRIGTAEEERQQQEMMVAEMQLVFEEQAQANADRARELGEDIEKLRNLADFDALTGLLNRRAFLPHAETALEKSGDGRGNFGIMMLDADHFKSVNDTWGHAAGDEVLRQIARTIEARIGTGANRAARFGGEEFVVLIDGIDEDAMFDMAEAIRIDIAALLIDHAGSKISITVSIGCAAAGAEDRDVEDIIHRADTALYAAKSGGRDLVVLSRGRDAARRAA